MIARVLALALAVVAAAATWFVFAPHTVGPPAGPPPGYLQAKGDALFNASFKPVSGAGAALPALRGQPLIAYFWPSWCGECAAEVKALQAVQDRHRNDGLVVLGFGVDQADRIERFARANAVGFAVFAGGRRRSICRSRWAICARACRLSSRSIGRGGRWRRTWAGSTRKPRRPWRPQHSAEVRQGADADACGAQLRQSRDEQRP